tara:strand:+ start:1660 stop:4089 length:2430 start_codon:yes stop_codon:yes gene_type:complete
MNRILLFLLAGLFLNTIQSQNATLKGVLMDGDYNEPLIGANIVLNTGNGASTNLDGEYSISTEPGTYNVDFKYVGYKTVTKSITLSAGEVKTINLTLNPSINQLDDVVVSASKYEQKLGEVPVSMAVIKPALIENKATRDAEAIIEQVPGVQVNENQISIRGGSGWSYGAGSRVLVMVDEMPMLAGDANDIKFSAIPMENIAQIEILKGASSVLYGSSALNGVINIRTKYPKEKPLTNITVSNGYYLPGYFNRALTASNGSDSIAERDQQTWWDGAQYYVQSNFTHLRKLGKNNELVVGGNFMQDQGYRKGSFENRYRLNGGLKHYSEKIDGLTYGLNVNTNFNDGSVFFIWANADSVLHALGGTDTATTTLSEYSSTRIMIDPYLTYLDTNGNKHNIRTRLFRSDNKNNTNQAATSNYYFAEYQFQKRWDNQLSLTTGLTFSFTDVISELYGDHTSNNIAGFLQLDKKWDKVTLTGGTRLEYYRIDSVFTEGKLFSIDKTLPFQPVFRLGATYNPMEYTFIRASYGQGYRFPSIAEKYISTFVGGLNIFPNANIQPEYGWSAEIGIKQGFKIKNFQGYLDLSGFLTQYTDMMEFVFGFYNLDGADITDAELAAVVQANGFGVLANYLGARSNNIQNANIPGFEASIVGQGDIGDFTISTLAGYTYINPTAINPDSAYLATFSDPDSKTLKYRNKHMAKIDFQVDYKKVAFGASIRYTSFMANVDKAFTEALPGVVIDGAPVEILPGYGPYRDARRTGDIVCDARLSFGVTKSSRLSLLMTNVFNREYSNRPANVLPPRTIICQYALKF